MSRVNAVSAVTGKLFDEDWSRVGRGRGVGQARHMARAAQGASPAIFKMIRTGGCASRSQLSAQFNYLFSKSVDVHDSRGLLDGAKVLNPEQIESAVSRWADNWKGQMNAARTSHMLMSFPRGAKPSHVSLIAGEICREKLGGRFDYMIAVHTDSPNKNPHAHIIVNRRGQDGDYFILRRGTEYSYEAFKEAMVDHADRYGIRLEATSRLQRGHIHYPPTDGEWRRARERSAQTGTAFEAPEGKPRIGDALVRATQEVRDWSLRYRDLASFASQQNMQDLATAFEKASSVLAGGGTIISKGEPYMSLVEDFDKAAANLRKAVDDAEQRIENAAPNQRPAMERKLAEALTSVEHLQPLGARSRDLRESASEEGIYSAHNLSMVNTRFALEGRDKLTAALDGTGIDPVEVEARMRVGANSAALEARWVQHDLQSVADLRGLDLRDQAQLQQAIAVVDAAYDRVADAYGVDDAIHQRAVTNRSTGVEVSTENPDPVAGLPTASELTEYPGYDEVRAHIQGNWVSRDGVEETRSVVIEDEGRFYPALEISRGGGESTYSFDDSKSYASLREAADNSADAYRYWEGLDTASQMERSRESDVLDHAPATSIGSQHHAQPNYAELARYARPVGSEDERRLREAIEKTLSSDELERLKKGDVDVLRGVGDRDDQLTMARDYLRAANDPEARHGLERISEQLSEERERQRQERGHEGGGHE
ncbi:relaxase/mobilization nuclease domain-containing protein [Paracoccus sp. WLY502]|uniref:relaxase/mobilization nuclease domain-containing protein n=1 Tax=Paracoccus yibinensis TaxID=3068891 RepID=UPI002796807C|nr:relaxase/mobilization nuclease domain-containing protein [Paracoccus sp. WLY502]MDQ1902520.1 relaxase/mobilization nuclease domain-containing protein [Paracoccus sp. WLY502]